MEEKLDEVIKILKNHEKRILELEKFSKKFMTETKTKKHLKKSLSNWILELRDNRFFSQPKIAEEVQKKLYPNYHCDLSRVKVALFRLSKRKELRRTSKVINGKKRVAYTW